MVEQPEVDLEESAYLVRLPLFVLHFMCGIGQG